LKRGWPNQHRRAPGDGMFSLGGAAAYDQRRAAQHAKDHQRKISHYGIAGLGKGFRHIQ